MTNELLESTLRARSLPGLSDEARSRLLAELDSVKIDEALMPSPRETKSRRPVLAICIGVGTAAAVVVIIVLSISILQAPMNNRQVAARPNIDSDQHQSTRESSATGESRETDSQDQRVQSLRRRSLNDSVGEAEAIVIASALKFDPAPPMRPGDAREHYITFIVSDVLKGDLADDTIVIRMPTDPQEFFTDPKEFVDKEWVVMLSPEYLDGVHEFAGLYTIKLEPEIRRILVEKVDD